MKEWVEPINKIAREELRKSDDNDDSHGFGHLCRVSDLAVKFAKSEGANELVVFAAGMLHDIISLPKNHPQSHTSSKLAANRAEELLVDLSFPKELIPEVCHAIHAHSFSAKVIPESIEAKCVQDADRMEALGAFGLMRVFYCCGKYGTEILDDNDPLAKNRSLDDKRFSLDHFEKKLLTLYETMQTGSGREVAFSLSEFLKEYRQKLVVDHSEGNLSSARFKIARVYITAGEMERSLFHATDSLGDNGRQLNPSEYALDSFLHDDDPYIRKFIDQFTFEVNGYE